MSEVPLYRGYSKTRTRAGPMLPGIGPYMGYSKLRTRTGPMLLGIGLRLDPRAVRVLNFEQPLYRGTSLIRNSSPLARTLQ
jgi:hypothetical protein